MSENNLKSGFTKTGFSMSGFACCSRHSLCESGKKECYYKEIDPDVPSICAAYQREHTNKETKPVLPASELKTPIIQLNEPKEEVDLQENEEGQLSLF